MNYRWYLWSLGFFATGLVMGVAFVIVGPVFMVRLLGSLAIGSSLAGGAIALWTLRADDPWQWELYRFRLARFFEYVGGQLRRLKPELPHLPA